MFEELVPITVPITSGSLMINDLFIRGNIWHNQEKKIDV